MRADVAPFDLARAYVQTDRRDAARGALARLRLPADASPIVLTSAGDLARAVGDMRMAAEHYARALARAPEDATLHERLGLALIVSGDVAGAIAAPEQWVARDPARPTARLNLAVAYVQADRPAAAIAQLREAIRIDPTYTRARELLERLHR